MAQHCRVLSADGVDAKFRIITPFGTFVTAEIDYDGVAGGTGATVLQPWPMVVSP